MGPSQPPGYSVMPIGHAQGHQGRQKYDKKRRAEVVEVRERGACLPCRISKKSVRMSSWLDVHTGLEALKGISVRTSCRVHLASEADSHPEVQLRGFDGHSVFLSMLAISTSSSLVSPVSLHLSLCLRDQLIIVGYHRHSATREPSVTLMKRLYDEEDFELAFQDLFCWDLEVLCSNVLAWSCQLPGNAPSSAAESIGILSSTSFQRLASSCLGDCLTKNVRLLLEVTPGFRDQRECSSWAGASTEDLLQIRLLTGSKVVKELDKSLKSSYTGSTRQQAQVLFLIIFSVLLAIAKFEVSYWNQLIHSAFSNHRACFADHGLSHER